MSDATYSEYWGYVDSIIDDIKDGIQHGNITMPYEIHEHVTEEVDGSQWIIYTYRNIKCLEYSQHEDALFEEVGNLEAESFSDAMQKMAYYAMIADVMSRIDINELFEENAPCDNCRANPKVEDSEYCEECEAELNAEVDDE